MSLYTDLVAAGIPTDNHESDLYFLDCPEAREIAARYPGIMVRRFISQCDLRVWVEAPFMFDPFWYAKRGAA